MLLIIMKIVQIMLQPLNTCFPNFFSGNFKHEKDPWRSVNFSKVTLLYGSFSRFLDCTNSTKSRNTTHILRVFCNSE